MTDSPASHPERADWSVLAVTLEPEARVLVSESPDLRLRSASTAKLLLLLAVARGIERGELSPDEPVRRDAVAPVADSGLWHRLRADELALDDAARLVGAVSDNLATNVLIARLGGVERVAAVAADYAVEGVSLHDIVRDERTSQHPATLSTGTAAGYVSLLRRLAVADGIEPAVARRVLDWLLDGADLSMVAGAFGLDPLSHRALDRGMLLRNKTGTDTGVRVDVGVGEVDGVGVAYASLANWTPVDDADPERDRVLARMREIGSEIRRALDQ
jgi:beta-lactamase class A